MARRGGRTHRSALKRVGWALAAGVLAVVSAAGTSSAAWQTSVPGQPTGLSAAAAGNGEVALSWDDPSDSTITGYEFDFQAEIAKLTALDAAGGDQFGHAVAVDGEVMVVGAPGEDSFRGAAYVYVRDAGAWSEAAKLTASDAAASDYFGWSVAVDGATVVVGAYRDDDGGAESGSVYVFSEPAGGWATATSDVKLTASDAAGHDHFGRSVAVDGATVVVGASGDDDGGTESGSVYVFSEPVSGWVSAASSVKLTASDAAAHDVFGWSVAVDGATVVVGAYGDDDGAGESGSVYVFSEPAGGWVTATSDVKLTALDGAADDLFGRSVAVDGATVVVGASGDDDGGADSGSVYVFSEPVSGWVSAASSVKLTASDAAAHDVFGWSVAVDGATVVVGAYADDDGGSSAGSAYVFGKPAGGWVSVSSDVKLVASDPAAGDYFGRSVAVDGATMAVGSYRDDDDGSNSGSAYVFHASFWTAVPDSAPGGANATSHTVTHLSSASYGFRVRAANSVGVSVATAAVAATASLTVPGQPTGLSTAAAGNGEVALSWDDPSDSTITGYEFDFQAELAKLSASDAAAQDYFGRSVAIDGDTMVVGAPTLSYNAREGAAYVYVRDAGVWSHAARLTASDGHGGDGFGLSVAIDGATVVVGAYGDDDGGSGSGSAYVFSEPASGWVSATSDVKLTASDAAAGDMFGRSVAVDGGVVVVGAYGDDDGGGHAGSAYVFSEPASGWVSASSDVKLTASDAASGDRFGWSVAVDGATVVVGAYQDNDGGTDAGSAYVFSEPASGWVSASSDVKLTASDPASGDRFGVSVAIDGGIVVVGAYEDDDGGTDSGSAYVFSEPASGWVSASSDVKLTASDPAAEDWFGWSVAIEGATVVVSAHEDDDGASGAGSAYVFSEPAGGWVSVSSDVKLTASDPAADDYFGVSVAVDGATVVVGASGDDDDGSGSGSAYVFHAAAWTPAPDSAPGGVNATSHTITHLPSASYEFRVRANNSVGVSVPSASATATASLTVPAQPTGLSAAAGGNGEVALSWADGSDSTIAGYEFDFQAEVAKLTASDAAGGDQFGHAVAVDGDTMVVGAPSEDSLRGAAYVFVRDAGVWGEAAKLTASDGAQDDWFGWSVAIDGDTVVVGAFEDDDGAFNAGSAYVFTKPVSGWATAASSVKLTASDPAAGDWFGKSVAIDGATVVVGAENDDDGGTNSGSAYVFSEPAGGWASATSNVKLTASDAAGSDVFGRSVAIDDGTVVVGAGGDDDGAANSGSVYVFSEPAGGWASATSSVKLTASDPAADDWFGRSVAIHGTTIVVGADLDDDGGANSGSAYVFSEPADGWATATSSVKLTASDSAAGDRFGWSVAIDGDTVVVGAYGDDDGGSSSGSAYVFSEPAGGWASATSNVKLTASDPAADDSFGSSVAIHSTTVLAGAHFDDDDGSNSGSAYVFHATAWTAIPNSAPGETNATTHTITHLPSASYELRVRATNSIGASAPTAAVTATASLTVPAQPTGLSATPANNGEIALSWDDGSDSSIAGYEYDFQAEIAKLTASDPAAYDRFGRSVAVDGDTMVVGAYGDNSYRGAAYVYVREAGVWNQAAKLTASDAATSDYFGWSVAVDGATVVVGAILDDDGGADSGSAYVFSEPAGGWVSATSDVKLTASDPAANDLFGYSVAIDGGTVVVGAHGDDDGGTGSGSVYVFSKPAGGWVSATSNVKLTASDPAANDEFGWSVAVDGGTVVVGAYRDDDGGARSGSAYVFSEPASGWVSASSDVKLTASDSAAGDRFGVSVAVDGGTVVVGAHWDDDGGTESGSVYVFSEPASGWVSASSDVKLTASDAAAYDWFGYSVAVDGDTIVVGAHWNHGGASDSGSAYVFSEPASGWVSATSDVKLTASDAAAGDRFGVSVAVDGGTVVVGAPHDDDGGSESGSAYVFHAAAWAAVPDSAPGGVNAASQTVTHLSSVGYEFRVRAANSVGVSAPTAAVTATASLTVPAQPTGLSAASAGNGEVGLSWDDAADSSIAGYEFDFQAEIAKLTASDPADDDHLGRSVAVDGDTMVVGAPTLSSNAREGAAYVYVRDAGVWNQEAKLTASDGHNGDLFGWSVAIDGATVVVGAYGDDDGGSGSGSAYVFSEPASGWASVAGSVKLTAADPAAVDAFGYSVAVDGGTVVVGAYGDDDGGSASGSAYVFSEPAGGWVSATSSVKLTAADPAADDAFGWSVAVDGATVVVGAYLDDDGGTDSGSVYVFSEPAGGWVSVTSDVKLTAADPAADDLFGRSVAVDDGTVVVGADGDDDGGTDSGSAYVFSEPAGGWVSATSDVKLTAADAAADDLFGYSVAVDGAMVVVGADRDDDGGTDSGSAYVFSEPAGGWASATSDAKLTASDPAASDRFGYSVAIDDGTVVIGAYGDDDGGSDTGSAYVFHASLWTAVPDSAPGGMNATSYTVTNLSDASYEFRVRANNSIGVSAPSAGATATLVGN